MPRKSHPRNKLIFHFRGGHESASQLIGITVGPSFYSQGVLFADDNTRQILGYVGEPLKLTNHYLGTLMLCALEGEVKLGRLADLGIWTASPRTIHQKLLDAFGTVKLTPGGTGEEHMIIQFARSHDGPFTAVLGNAKNKGPGRDTADEDTVVKLVWPPGYQVAFDTEDRARTYVAQLEREARFPGASAEHDERYVYVSSSVKDSKLVHRIRSLGLQVHDAGAPRDSGWFSKLANSAAVVIDAAGTMKPWQYAELGFARGKEVPILVSLAKGFNQSAVMETFDATPYQAEDPSLMTHIHECVVTPTGQVILGQITELVQRAMQDAHAPVPGHELPSRIRMENSVAAATRKQMSFGLAILAAGRGLRRFLNLFTHYADRRYGVPMARLIAKAQEERVSLSSIVRAICLPEISARRVKP